MRLLLPAALAVVLAIPATAATPLRLPGAPNCPVFPSDNPWNKRVDHRPVAADSARLIRSMGGSIPLHPGFGRGYGMPYTVVSKHTRRYRVRFDYASGSDHVRYPIPRHPRQEDGVDGHILLVDRDACRLYELYKPRRHGTGWDAGAGAVWNLRSNRLRPRGKLSADAAGLPILPGVARLGEVRRGAIRHALRFTTPRTREGFIFPARHSGSYNTDASLPRMGLRVRLRSNYSLKGYPRQARIVLTALKRYGMILADNGSAWRISGVSSRHWSRRANRAMTRVHGSDFEVVAPSH